MANVSNGTDDRDGHRHACWRFVWANCILEQGRNAAFTGSNKSEERGSCLSARRTSGLVVMVITGKSGRSWRSDYWSSN